MTFCGAFSTSLLWLRLLIVILLVNFCEVLQCSGFISLLQLPLILMVWKWRHDQSSNKFKQFNLCFNMEKENLWKKEGKNYISKCKHIYLQTRVLLLTWFFGRWYFGVVVVILLLHLLPLRWCVSFVVHLFLLEHKMFMCKCDFNTRVKSNRS